MTRVLIVGAGPAGIRAAATFVEAGIRPVVVDEGARAGGQIYRRPPEEFSRSAQLLYGSEAGKAIALHQLFDSLVAQDRVIYLPNRTVVGLSGGAANLVGPVIGETITYDQLILATGAMDRVVPVPGWEAPGVYTLGAAQIALKGQGIALGRNILLAGSGPLLTLVGAQLLKAGAQVAAVLDTAPLWSQIRGGLEMALARPRVTARGLGLRAQLGRRYHAGVTLKGIESDVRGPTAMHWVDGFGRTKVTKCDVVALGWHLRAETALADLAGAGFDWSETWGQWLPSCSDEGRAGPQLYLAGDGKSILGAEGAEVAGRIAANACLEDMGLYVDRVQLARDLKQLGKMRRFAEGIARAFPWPAHMIRR
ncbi:MAG: NAD(P)/FAD-dependent oxidoreductase, partial [Novosphingobium sp.]|nr:NAD(P)/FAD-dependent oxidoreductase [Novosphingobium sp.]